MLNNKDAVEVTISYDDQTRTITGDFGISIVMKQAGPGHVVKKSVVGMHDEPGAVLMIQQLRVMEKEIRSLLGIPDEVIDQMLKSVENRVSSSAVPNQPCREMSPQDMKMLILLMKMFEEDPDGH